MVVAGVKPTRIDLEGWPLPDTVSIDGVYSGDDVDFDEAPGMGGQDQWKQPVRCATTASVTIASDLNAGDAIDGVTLAAGDRVLVKNQGTASQNGIYVAGTSPARAADMDEDTEVLGSVVYVIDGTANAGTLWAVTNDAATTVDTDAIAWAQTGGAGTGPDTSLVTVASTGATETVDVSVARTYDLTLTADCTITLSGATAGEAHYVTIIARQDGTGGRDLTWPASVAWPGGVDPVPDTTASTAAVYTLFTLDGGTNWFGFETGGGGGTPATTVESETTWGITPAVGTDTAYARQDHTHGTPAQPVSTGELLVADTSGGTPGVLDNAYVEMTTQRTTTSATLVDITGASTSITLTRAADIAVWLNCQVSANGVCDIGVAINIDGTDHDMVQKHLLGSDAATVAVVHRSASPLAAGTYTVKGRFERVSGGSTPAIDRADLLVVSTGTGGPVALATDDGSDFLYSDT